jgi:soluble lytic murein transglycosylase-like protein
MSVVATDARVAELRAMIDSVATGVARTAAPATTTVPSAAATSFSAQLAAASAPAVPAAPGAGAGAQQYGPLADAAAARYGLDPALLRGLIQQESGFDPGATSAAGAQGLTQLMPGTASALGVTDPLDPAQSIDGGARYLRQQLDRFGGDVSKALAAYNAGPGAVERFGGVPPYAETQGYVAHVLDLAAGVRSGVAP